MPLHKIISILACLGISVYFFAQNQGDAGNWLGLAFIFFAWRIFDSSDEES